jgi:hypothetical protein
MNDKKAVKNVETPPLQQSTLPARSMLLVFIVYASLLVGIERVSYAQQRSTDGFGGANHWPDDSHRRCSYNCLCCSLYRRHGLARQSRKYLD